MSSDDEENYKKRAILESNGVKHEVEFYVENNEMLVIQVENCNTQQHWVGKYDASYIEELSHKTGNFKQFDIFCSMLETSLLHHSESVMLDILSYDDLKVLREQKLGAKTRKPKEKAEKLQTKRYLIMTYTVEFDQIHYPLPLTYTGSSDASPMKNKLKELQNVVDNLRENDKENSSRGNKAGGVSELNKLLKENKELREELAECRRYMKEIGGGNFAKELKVLKKVIQNLETDLLRERSKHHNMVAKKKKEYDKLMAEFEQLKANERNYRVRCKSLTEELAMLKKESRDGVVKQPTRKHSTRAVNSHSRSRERSKPLSNSREVFRRRSTSNERSGSVSSLRRTPSPGVKRFDPSAYVKERDRKRKESEVSSRRTPSSSKRNITPVSYSRLSKPPSSGKVRNSSNRSANRSARKNYSSSVASERNSPVNMKKRHSTERLPSRRPNNTRSDTSDDEFYQNRNYPRSKVKSVKKDKPTPDQSNKDDESSHAIGIAEIDARLEALQKFMHDME